MEMRHKRCYTCGGLEFIEGNLLSKLLRSVEIGTRVRKYSSTNRTKNGLVSLTLGNKCCISLKKTCLYVNFTLSFMKLRAL